MMEVFRTHPGALFSSAVSRARCICIVLFLEAKSGLIEFEGLVLSFAEHPVR